MTSRIFKLLSADSVITTQVRYKFSRGKPPLIARNLEQRIAEMEYKDPNLYYKVDIGFPLQKNQISNLRKQWIEEVKACRENPELEKKALLNQLSIDMDKIREVWLLTDAPYDIHRVAKHYGIFDDLYEDAYFYPVIPLTIDYDFGHEELLARVYTGNLIKSFEAEKAPNVSYEADSNSFYTLLLTTPDGNYSNPEFEYCHWFIGNIPGNDVSKGEEIIDYLRPIPAKGIGFCRYIFVLYKQDKKIDFSEYKKDKPCLNLVDRNWKTYDFIRKHQDYVTPSGLAFFQTDYDPSLKEFYHKTLEMELPIYEYDFPKPFVKPQVWFPLKEAFNKYLDRYRDPKQINKEFLLKKLKKEHPFKFPDPPLKYPNAHPIRGYVPSWLKTEIQKERLNQGRILDCK
ncbi:large ribosomal subunit protein mL38 [Phymastichus coffea]|uniref:large ribosomal subunit protein mL38 n=1 Tax=Phymastichus coffea TaxID=108790 RepID=UPI00273BA63D|nr:large ribosomal subunit protein mL38 [Phymastichus coffea]